jgi:hypothetical protein
MGCDQLFMQAAENGHVEPKVASGAQSAKVCDAQKVDCSKWAFLPIAAYAAMSRKQTSRVRPDNLAPDEASSASFD